MHFTGIHTDFLGAKEGACITSAYGKSDSKWPLKSVWFTGKNLLDIQQVKLRSGLFTTLKKVSATLLVL